MNQFELLKRVQEYLLNSGLKPGDKLPTELELAKKFSVARGTIREIIIHMSLLGILERSTKKGTFIRKAEADDIGRTLNFQLQNIGCSFEELKATRLILESSQVSSIIQYASPALIENLENINNEMAKQEKAPENADALDLKFHLNLLAISANRIIQTLGQVMLIMFESKYRKKFHTANAIKNSVKTHDKIIDAIKNKNMEELQKLINEHIAPL